MATLRFKREELIEALEGRRAWAEEIDARNLAEHQKAEKEYLAKFKAACREAAKWDYATAKRHHFEVMDDNSWDRPRCPQSIVAKLDANLNTVKASYQSRYTIADGGGWSQVFYLLTHDETIKAEMC